MELLTLKLALYVGCGAVFGIRQWTNLLYLRGSLDLGGNADNNVLKNLLV